MKQCGVWQRTGRVIALAALSAALAGCGGYLKARGRDAAQMVDIGLTKSQKPCTAFFLCGISIVGFGKANLEGTFSGIGGNQVGTTRCYYRSIGYGPWTYEEIGWGDFDVARPQTLYAQYGAIGGWFHHFARKPGYAPACNHYIHFGRRGVVFNLRYVEILDFLLGWTTLDICGDDGDDPMGHWPWQSKGACNMPPRYQFSSPAPAPPLPAPPAN